MTTTNKKYPFPTRREIVLLVQEDHVFMEECLGILYAAQTAVEQATLSTKVKNRQGFMSSHAVVGSRLAQKAAEGLSPEETAQATQIVSRYGRQLAAYFREEAMQNDPSLREVARLFSAA